MRRPQSGEYGEYYQGYIDLTRGANFLQNLEDSGAVLLDILDILPKTRRQFAYQPGKWTVSQMLQHIIDTDTVMTYRALWLARTGGGELEGFDHDKWAQTALESQMKWPEMLEQFRNLRNFGMGLFHSFTEEMMEIKGTVNGHETTLRSIPFIMAGHTFHHIATLKEHYT